MRLATRLFLAFMLVVVLMGGIGLLTSYWLITRTVFDEAQFRTDLDLRSARAQLDARLRDVQLAIESIAHGSQAAQALRGQDLEQARGRLERTRREHGLDVLGVADPAGNVTLRARRPVTATTTAPANLAGDPVIEQALPRPGEPARAVRAARGYVLLSQEQLQAEAPELAREAYIKIRNGDANAPGIEQAVTGGLMLWAAVPVIDDAGQPIGAVYGGVLLNRNSELIDQIRDVVFGADQYAGKELGTVTVFLNDVRVATNVRDPQGNRALGTQVSPAVRERVLDSKERYYGRAKVVDNWYLAAYEPLRNPDGNVIGMLYTGILLDKYADLRNQILWSWKALSPTALGTLLGVVLAMVLARVIARPVNQLELASRRLAEGDLDYRPPHQRSIPEVENLSRSFRQMADAISERDMRLREQNVELEEANVQLTQLNASYMDMLGFVTHELKNPLNSMIFGACSLRDEFLGPLNQEQKKVIQTILRNAEYLEEMIAHYLDLSRIEKGEFAVHPRPIDLVGEVVEPAVSQIQSQLDASQMQLKTEMPPQVRLMGDPAMLRVVVDNLVSNAIKYGQPGGRIELSVASADGQAKVSVWNQGPGISQEGLARLFGKFVRLEPRGEKHRKGTGLGLFISREIVNKHGGRIWAESQPGQWTRFTFTMPTELNLK